MASLTRKRRRVDPCAPNIQTLDFDLPCPLLSIYNFKGGVGKTMTSVNFARHAAARGKKVLLVDLDGQCNLTSLLDSRVGRLTRNMGEQPDEKCTIDQAITDQDQDFKELVLHDRANLLTFWNAWMEAESKAEVVPPFQLVVEFGETGGDLWFLRGSHSVDVIEQSLRTMYNVSLRLRFALVFLLKKAMLHGNFDLAVADLSPGNSILNRSVLFASSGIVVPAFADHNSLTSTHAMFRNILGRFGPTQFGRLKSAQYVYKPNVLRVVFNNVRFIVNGSGRWYYKIEAKWMRLMCGMVQQFANLFVVHNQPRVRRATVRFSHNLLKRGSHNIVTSTELLPAGEGWKVEEWVREMDSWLEIIGGDGSV